MIYAIVLPLAVFIGWLVAGDMTRTSFATLSAIIFVLLLPFLLKFHYPMLIFSWNTFISIFFLSGQPGLWMIMVIINFGLAILNRIIRKQQHAFISAPSITISLLVLAAVVLFTATFRGGLGVQALGSSMIGGKGYYLILAGILGYFAFASQPIPLDRAKFYVGLFFISGLISAGSTLIYLAGPSFYFFFALFPVEFASVQASSEIAGQVSRVAGFGTAASAGIFWLLSRNGIRGVITKWWRLLLVLALIPLAAMGGYRTTIVMIGLTLVLLFVVEGLLRTSYFPTLLVAASISFAVLIPMASHLPKSMQRALSFLPGLKLNPFVKYEAQASTEWRVMMWEAMRPDLPKYAWLGKGYALNATDLYLADEVVRRHRMPSYYISIISGNYHNGPLSIYVPFGGIGSLAFLAFFVVSLRALYLNYRWGAEQLKTLNRFLFAYFIARVTFFFLAFGAISTELYIFTGLAGLSVALNRGICRKPAAFATAPVRLRGTFDGGSVQPRPA
jgi:O-antigen ligase